MKFSTFAIIGAITIPMFARAIPPSSQMQWPIPGKTVADTSFFFGVDDSVGDLRKCSDNRFYTHLGTDILAAPGTTVYPIYPGKVERVAQVTGWGWYILLSHDNNTWTSVYWHTNPLVSKGQMVYKDTQIATVYDTATMGDISHLHLGIRNLKTDLNPAPNSYSGYFGCTENTQGFVQPYQYLPKSDHFIADDKDGVFAYQGNWAISSATEFYYGSGYHLLAPNASGSAEFNRSFSQVHNYVVSTRIPVDPNRTNSARYDLYVNGVLKTGTNINQANMAYRGQNVKLFDLVVQPNDTIKIRITNQGTGYLVVDNMLFVDQ
ncbi:MAG: peptidoglycan DD-metalloendopeptidase family protein [Patescibacteria group bacterium]